MGSKKRFRAYLSGGMEYAHDEGSGWRMALGAWIEKELGHSVFNPNLESERLLRKLLPGRNMRKLKETDMKTYASVLTRIVRLDSREIAFRSDYVICLWDRSAAQGAGTKGEITIARFFGKPVFLVTRYPLHRIPGWVIGCVSETFSSISELKKFLQTKYKNNRK